MPRTKRSDQEGDQEHASDDSTEGVATTKVQQNTVEKEGEQQEKKAKKSKITIVISSLVICTGVLIAAKLSSIVFKMAKIGYGLKKTGIIESYKISGLQNCLGLSGQCTMHLEDVKIKMGQNGYVSAPMATIFFNSQHHKSIATFQIPRQTPVKFSLGQGDKAGLVIIPLQDAVFNLNFQDGGWKVLSESIQLSNILLNNQTIGFITSGRIMGSFQNGGLKKAAKAVKAKGQQQSQVNEEEKSNAAWPPIKIEITEGQNNAAAKADEKGQTGEISILLNLKMKTMEYQEIINSKDASLSAIHADGAPVSINTQIKTGKTAVINLAITTNSFEIEGKVETTRKAINGRVSISNWRAMIDDTTNYIVHINANANTKGVKNEEILSGYADVYRRIFPTLVAAQKPGTAKGNGNLLLEVETKEGEIMLNGIKFDNLFNM